MNDQDSTDTQDQTRIDLAEDLLESAEAPPPEEAVFDSQDAFETARILKGEGLLDEAKAVLYRILREDSHHIRAKKLLEEIHELELKQLFSDESARRHTRKGEKVLSAVSFSESEATMRKLDAELKLGVFEEDQDLGAAPTELSLFQDKNAFEEFSARLERECSDLPPRERIDLGIAFLEMGFHELALRQFRASQKKLFLEGSDSKEMLLSAVVLTATALIRGGRPFDAIDVLEQVIWDSEIEELDKVELLYLLGTAHERVGKKDSARQWFREVARLDPHYRDVQDRIR